MAKAVDMTGMNFIPIQPTPTLPEWLRTQALDRVDVNSDSAIC